MSLLTTPPVKRQIEYTDSDGQPMAENTKQFELIVTIQGGLDTEFKDDPNVFVAADLFWYPKEGNNALRTAADVMVVFGRPKGHRGSYRQWEEGGIAPQVVFEIYSPGNRFGEMLNKFRFYEEHGVEEYYLFDPDKGKLEGWLRRGEELQEIENMQGWVSPRLGVRFEVADGELQLFGKEGRRFSSYVELAEAMEKERQAKEKERSRAERLSAQLRALGAEPEA